MVKMDVQRGRSERRDETYLCTLSLRSEARTILTAIFTIQGMLKKSYQRRSRPCAVLTY